VGCEEQYCRCWQDGTTLSIATLSRTTHSLPVGLHKCDTQHSMRSELMLRAACFFGKLIVVILSVVMLSVVLSVFLMSVVMLSVVMLSVIMLSVMAPFAIPKKGNAAWYQPQ
jgi:F0F1-type ATP synthase assembly protein I